MRLGFAKASSIASSLDLRDEVLVKSNQPLELSVPNDYLFACFIISIGPAQHLPPSIRSQGAHTPHHSRISYATITVPAFAIHASRQLPAQAPTQAAMDRNESQFHIICITTFSYIRCLPLLHPLPLYLLPHLRRDGSCQGDALMRVSSTSPASFPLLVFACLIQVLPFGVSASCQHSPLPRVFP